MSLIERLLGRPMQGGSGAIAKERLKFVLEFDRTHLSPMELDQIRDEIIDVISRHVSVRRRDVHISLEDGRLVAEIPLDSREARAMRPSGAR
jgi:cell division topological specificity factor